MTAMDQNSDGQQALLWGGAQMGTHMLLILGESVFASIGTCKPTSQKACSCEISESGASEDFAGDHGQEDFKEMIILAADEKRED